MSLRSAYIYTMLALLCAQVLVTWVPAAVPMSTRAEPGTPPYSVPLGETGAPAPALSARAKGAQERSPVLKPRDHELFPEPHPTPPSVEEESPLSSGEAFAGLSGSAGPEEDPDAWVINETVVIRDQHIELNQSIIIQAGGNLTLINSTLHMEHDLTISVEEGGVLNVVENSNITGSCWLYVNGTLTSRDSRLYFSEAHLTTREHVILERSWLYTGYLEIANSTDVKFENCTIRSGRLWDRPALACYGYGNHVRMVGCTIELVSYEIFRTPAIRLYRTSNVSLTGCLVRLQIQIYGEMHWAGLIAIEESQEITISNCTLLMTGAEWWLSRASFLMRIEASSDVLVSGCALIWEQAGYGECNLGIIHVQDATYVRLRNCVLSLTGLEFWETHYATHVYTVRSSNIEFYNCTLALSLHYVECPSLVYIYDSEHVVFHKCYVPPCHDHLLRSLAIRYVRTAEVLVRDCLIDKSIALSMYNVSYVSIYNTTAYWAIGKSVYIRAYNSTFCPSCITECVDVEMHNCMGEARMDRCTDTRLYDCMMDLLEILECENTVMVGCHVHDYIEIYSTVNMTIASCTVQTAYMSTCKSITVEYCQLNGTLTLDQCTCSSVIGNTFIRGGLLLSGSELCHFLHDIHDNTVGGKPICYVVNATGYVLPGNAGQVIVVNSENVVARDLIMGNASVAVELAFTENAIIYNCTLKHTDLAAMVLTACANVTICYCEFTHNYRNAIELASACTNVTICCCEIAYNHGDGIYITGPALGIEIHFCSIYSNEGAGLRLRRVPNVVNATYNWWGSYFGPEITPYGDEEDPDEISIYGLERYGDVLYAPWLRQPYVPDTVAPTVSITAPSAGSYVSGTATIRVQASDNVGVARVEFYIDGELVCVDRSAPYECEWDTTSWPEGEHTIRVVAYDTSGNVGEDQVTVIVDNTSPSVTDVDFTPKRPLPFEPVSVQARAGDVLSGVASGILCYRVNGGRWHVVEMTVRYLGSKSEAMLYGSIPGQPKGAVVEFYVIAYDRAGNAMTSPIYTYTVGKSSSPSRGQEGLSNYGLPLLAVGTALLAAALALSKRFLEH